MKLLNILGIIGAAICMGFSVAEHNWLALAGWLACLCSFVGDALNEEE